MSQTTSGVGANVLAPFSKPVRPFNPMYGPDQIRGNDNQTARAFNAHDSDASIHLVRTTTTSVTTSAIAIYPAITHSAYAVVNGDTGSGKAFVDQVVWNGTANTATPLTSTSTQGVADARTYTVVSGVLKVTMAAGTYTVVVVPVVFTT